MTTIYNLPSNLPQPPAPPEGYRWSICGHGIPGGHIKDGAIAAVCFGYGEVWRIHNPVIGNYGSNRNNFYVRAIPLREVPTGLPPLEPGWEYACKGEIQLIAKDDDLANVAGFDINWPGWEYGGWWGDYHENHYALKIGSKVHFENIVQATTKTSPAMDYVSDDPVEDIVVPASEYNALVAERDTLQFDLASAVAILKRYLNGEGTNGDARAFVARFEPPFDWDTFWASLPVWIEFVAMDENGMWFTHATKPSLQPRGWLSKGNGEIPENYAPPQAPDWEKSLVERPKNN